MKHTFRKCLSFVLALATLFSVCVLPLSAAPVASDPKCDHYKYITEADFVRTQAAKCDDIGGDVYHCPECGENFVHKDTWVKELGHDMQPNYDYEENVAPVDYDTPGELRYECTRCDEAEMRDWWKGCANGKHSVVKGKEAPDCTKATTRTDTCALCDWTETVEVAPLGHKWNNGEITVTPICGERDAIVTFTCTREGCDDGVDGAAAIYTVTEIAPVNHKWTWYAEDLGECGRNGNYAGYNCEFCDVWSEDGVTVKDLVIVNPKHNWTVCTNEEHAHEGTAFDGCHAGVVYLYCTNEICQKCVVDNRVPTQKYEVGQSGNHVLTKIDGEIYSAGMTRTEAAKCMRYATYSCTCGYVVTSEFPEDQRQHNWKWPTGMTGEVNPTCNTYGYKSCYDCGATEGYADINGDPIPGNEKYNKLNHIPQTITVTEGGIEFTYNYYGIIPEVGTKAFEVLMEYLDAKYEEATCAAGAYWAWYCPYENCEHNVKNYVEGGEDIRVKHVVGDPNKHTTVTVPHKDATCTEDGVAGGTYCSACGLETGTLTTKEKAEKVLPALGHTWEADNDIVAETKGEGKTSYWGYVPANCSYDAHDGVLCGRCDVEQKNGPKRGYDKYNEPANGAHVYVAGDSDELITPATCTTPALRRYYCYVCNKEDVAAVDPNEKVGHSWELDATELPVLRVPATCQNKGYDVFFCTKCSILTARNEVTFTKEDHDRFISHFQFTGDPSKDVSAVYNESNETWTFTLNPTGHDAIKADAFNNVSLVYDAAAQTFSVVLADGVALKDIINAPEATADGKYTGYVGFDDPKTPELDGYNEEQNLGVCGIYSYYEWNCSECGYRYNKHIEDKFGLTGDHVEVAVVDNMDCATGHTGKNGATECKRCEQPLKAGVEVPVKHTIDKEAAGYIGKTTADCLNPGWDEYGVCTVCTAYYTENGEDGLAGDYIVDNGNVYRYNGWVKELGHKVGVSVDAQKVTCTEPGWDAHIKCVRCDYVVDNTTIDADADTDAEKYANIKWVEEMTAANGINNYKDPTDHNFTKNPSLVPMQCMKDGYIWYDCCNENCSAVSVVNYKYGWAEHRYSNTDNVTDVVCKESFCLCQNTIEIKFVLKTGVATDKEFYVLDDYNIKTALCNNKNVLREAGDHMNAATETKESEIIDLSDCLFYDDIEDHKCIYCNTTFEVEDYDHHDCESDKRVAANCQNYAYTLWACTRCTYTWITDKGDTLGGHDYTVPLADKYVAPTWTTDGFQKKKCYYCSDVIETVIPAPDMFFDMSIDNIYDMKDEFGGNYTWDAVNKYYKKTNKMTVSTLANSSFVAVTVYATGSATNFTSIQMNIKFDSAALQFSPAMTEKNNGTLMINGVEFVVIYNDAGGSVELFINAANAADKKPQNAELTDRTALITLYFQVDPDFYDDTDANLESLTTELHFDKISVLEYDRENDTTKEVDDIVTDTGAPKADYPEVNGGAYELTVYKLGDVNGDGIVTDTDAILVEAKAFEGGYDAQADIDKDGDVDLVDFMYMKQYLIKVINYPQLAAKLNVATDAE